MKKILFIQVFIFLMVVFSCARKTIQTANPAPGDGRYDSEFPFRNASREIESITHSLRKIYSSAYYRTYLFTESAKIKQHEIATEKLRTAAINISGSHESYSGTATVLSFEKNHLALITCAHILDFPDTIITFFENSSVSTDNIKSISIREKQEIYVKDIPGCGTMNILAIDKQLDIAIIGKYCEGISGPLEIFQYPAGKAKELEWGSFVYILGYPLGFLMVTKGIVSNPRGDEMGSFMIDALFNKGASGSIILAVRDGIPNFEMVGMIKSVASKQDYFLKPEKEPYEYLYRANAPYTGEFRIGINETINYGVTYVIPMEAIRAFYLKNRLELLLEGYNLDNFFRQ